MKPTLNWFDKVMIAITYAEENAYEVCLEPKEGRRSATGTSGKNLTRAERNK